MIRVTPIAGRPILLNADLVEAIESTPETVIVLANGTRMVVIDSPAVLMDRLAHVRSARLAAAHALRTTVGDVVPLRGKGDRA